MRPLKLAPCQANSSFVGIPSSRVLVDPSQGAAIGHAFADVPHFSRYSTETPMASDDAFSKWGRTMDRKEITFTTITGENEEGLGETESDPGVVIEVQPGVVLRATKRGKLLLCDKCERYVWECTTGPDGTTWCTKVCAAWSCREVPAVGQIARMLSNA